MRVVEVFPPRFPAASDSGSYDLRARTDEFVDGVRSIKESADLILVADLKKLSYLKFLSVYPAALVQQRVRVDAAPVLVVRDANRPQYLSSVMTGLAQGLRSFFIAWGDEYPRGSRVTNVRDFQSLGGAIRAASRISKRSKTRLRILAPVNVDRLGTPKELAMAKGRVRAGASLLLAQPPTTDAGMAFDRHLSAVKSAGLTGRVLLNVFPFRSPGDVARSEKLFGWRLPRELHAKAAEGEAALLEEARAVVARAKSEGLPGVYVSTRGTPEIAKKILD